METMAKVQSFLGSLKGGDQVLFQRGGIWFEQLNLSNLNGGAGAPIVFGNYGTGNLPIIDDTLLKCSSDSCGRSQARLTEEHGLLQTLRN